MTSLPGGRVGRAVRRSRFAGGPRGGRRRAPRHGLPVLVIGRGSNMLVADAGPLPLDGIAVSIASFADEVDVPAAQGLAAGTP